MKQGNTFTFIDLFAGIGGMRKGFEAAGGKCVFTSERDIHAQTTYRANFPDDTHPVAGDIITVRSEDIPAHNVLLAGFPCQPFSLAGLAARKRSGKVSGFSCPSQGSLFFEIVRILKFHRPKAFLLENVKNLMSHDRGKTGRIILQTLAIDLGYTLQMCLLNARFWVPQNRERVFIAGFREETGFSFGPVMTHSSRTSPSLRDILHSEDGMEEVEEPYTVSRKAKVSDRYSLSDRTWAYLQCHARKHRERGNGFGYGLADLNSASRTLSARYGKDGSEILISQNGKNPRRLTPRECSRLMGFDYLGESKFQIPVSDTQAYRQFGNAVVVPLVHAIAEQMASWIFSAPTQGLFSPSQKGQTFSGETGASSQPMHHLKHIDLKGNTYEPF
jgi:DNA (cytosine-5)-methyltransferase 1